MIEARAHKSEIVSKDCGRIGLEKENPRGRVLGFVDRAPGWLGVCARSG